LSMAMGSPIFFFPWPFTQFYLHPLSVITGCTADNTSMTKTADLADQ
jgi:hypothetical protein